MFYRSARPVQATTATLKALRQLQHTVKMMAKKSESPQTELLQHKVPLAQDSCSLTSPSNALRLQLNGGAVPR
jgi:hypothetical protein